MSDLYVSTAGSDSNSGTKGKPLETIEQASEVADAGTTVHVAPGTYEGGFTTTANGVQYVSDAKWGAKIASGDGDTAWYNMGDNVTISGFEVNGSGTDWRLGLLTTGSNSVIENNKVHDIGSGSGGDSGAGIYADGYNGDTNITVRNNQVYGIGPEGEDSSQLHGIYHTTTGAIANNLVYDNAGAGIHLWHDARDVDIRGNTVYDSNMGVWVGGGDYYDTSGPADDITVANNTIHDNRTYGIAEGGDTGSNNSYTGNSVFENDTDWSLQNGLEPAGAAAAAGASPLDAVSGVAGVPQAFTDVLTPFDQTLTHSLGAGLFFPS